MKKKRKTLAAQIRGENSVFRKLDIAKGVSEDHRVGDRLANKADVFSFLIEAHRVQKRLMEKKLRSPSEKMKWAKEVDRRLAQIGITILGRIAMKDYAFFGMVFNALKFDQKPDYPNHQYAHMLEYCASGIPGNPKRTGNIGTTEHPCDPHDLLKYMRAHGCTYNAEADREIPKTFRDCAKRIGIVFNPATRAQPKKRRDA